MPRFLFHLYYTEYRNGRQVKTKIADTCGNVYVFNYLTSPVESGTIMSVNGTWRSLVARFLGVEEVASSNLAVPTSIKAFVQDWTKAFLVFAIRIVWRKGNRSCR